MQGVMLELHSPCRSEGEYSATHRIIDPQLDAKVLTIR
jgi:hypothetical protein